MQPVIDIEKRIEALEESVEDAYSRASTAQEEVRCVGGNVMGMWNELKERIWALEAKVRELEKSVVK